MNTLRSLEVGRGCYESLMSDNFLVSSRGKFFLLPKQKQILHSTLTYLKEIHSSVIFFSLNNIYFREKSSALCTETILMSKMTQNFFFFVGFLQLGECNEISPMILKENNSR